MRSILLLFCILFLSQSNVCYAQAGDSVSKHEGIVVATWNIGHFSKGQKDYSTISFTECKKAQEDYRCFIYDSLRADVLCINEYEGLFYSDSLGGVNVVTEKALFDGYRSRKIFKKNRFVCNALFSTLKLKNALMRPFVYNFYAKEENPVIEWHYYVMADFFIKGQKVKLVCTHLVTSSEKHRQNQIKELLKECEKFDRVIICGDMNTWDFSRFKKAGYSSATDGKIVTFPSKSYSLDNIFVKGLSLSNTKICKTELSDHYAVTCTVSL